MMLSDTVIVYVRVDQYGNMLGTYYFHVCGHSQKPPNGFGLSGEDEG